MSLTIRTAWPQDLERLAEFAVACQADPQRFTAYLGDDAASIAADVAEIENWTDATHVALDDRRDVVGWITAEADADMGRIGWWGPFVIAPEPHADDIADTLFRAAKQALTGFTEHELAADASSTWLQRFAARHGLVADEASVILNGTTLDVDIPESDLVVRAVDEAQAEQLATMHEEIFPRTHTTGPALVASADERHVRMSAWQGDRLCGYVAAETQNDGSLYIDYIGVDASLRNHGIGRVLLSHALRWGHAANATRASLTVREPNVAARALYGSMGFVEERIVVPYRLGFVLD